MPAAFFVIKQSRFRIKLILKFYERIKGLEKLRVSKKRTNLRIHSPQASHTMKQQVIVLCVKIV